MAAYLSMTVTESSINTANNTSVVTVNLYYYGNGVSYNGYSPSGSITIDGTKYSFSHSFTASTSAQLLATASKTVTHNDNGTKTVTCSASFATGVSLGTLTASTSKALTTIPRVSDIAVNKTSVPADGATTVTATATKKSTSFTDTISVKLGGYSKNVTSGATFTIPATWINAISGTSATATVTVTTKSGSTTIGTKSTTFTVTVPQSVVPTISSIEVGEAVSSVTANFGVYVKSLSQLNVKVNAEGVYGSTIKSYSTSVDGVTYVQNTFKSNVINAAGTIAIKATVTDSRGRSATKTVNISVIDYFLPTITSMSYITCDADGTQNSEGTYTKITIKGKVAPVISGSTNKNTRTLTLKYKASTATIYTSKTISLSAWDFNVSTIISGTDPTVMYEFIAELKDKTDTATHKITTGAIVLSCHTGGDGIAVGKEADSSGFNCAWKASFATETFAGGIDLFMEEAEADELACMTGEPANLLPNAINFKNVKRTTYAGSLQYPDEYLMSKNGSSYSGAWSITEEDGISIASLSVSGLSTAAYMYVGTPFVPIENVLNGYRFSVWMKVDDVSAWDSTYNVQVNLVNEAGTRKGYASCTKNSEHSNRPQIISGQWVKWILTVQENEVYSYSTSSHKDDDYSDDNIKYIAFRMQLAKNGSIHYKLPILETL